MEFKLKESNYNTSEEDFLKDILRVAHSLGKDTITRSEYSNNGGKYHPSTIIRRFGGWLKALELCGLSPNKRQIDSSSSNYTQSYITNQELIVDLQKVAKKLNKNTFTGNEYEQNGKYSRATYVRRFKTWNNALKVSGLVPFDHQPGVKLSEYELLEEIERIWITLGRQPNSTDMKSGISKYSHNTYDKHFGTWRKAIRFFVAYMNGEQEVEKPEEDDIQLPIEIPQENANKPMHKTKREINLRLRFTVMKRDNFKCCMCGRSPATTPGLELHIDHIIPWSKGGETTIDNLQTLCSDCNLGKSNLSEND